MKKRIAILANHSGGLYDFRKDLIAELKNTRMLRLLSHITIAGRSFMSWWMR